jgi:ElaB/YqjD/DUF883 family membrane-anchored ribosome-binding protein
MKPPWGVREGWVIGTVNGFSRSPSEPRRSIPNNNDQSGECSDGVVSGGVRMNEIKTTGPVAVNAVTPTERALRDELEALREDMRKLKTDAADAAVHAARAARVGAAQAGERVKSAAHAAAEKAGEVYDKAKETAEEAYDRVKEQAGRARDTAKYATRQVEHAVEEHPLMAIGIAFGAGLLIGALLRSRD